MTTTKRTHTFHDENDDRTVVHTEQLVTGRYKAWVAEGLYEDLDVRGYGPSRFSAIADLNNKIESAAHVFVKDGGEL
jgi:hypothetical protein